MINCWGLVLTIVLFNLAKRLKKYPIIGAIPPVLITGIVLIVILKLLNLSFENYNTSGCFLTFLLIPAIIALGYPLYKHFNILLQNKRIIYSAFLFAIIVTIAITVFVAKLCHANSDIIVSMLPKSVTAPIAIEISKTIGGIPELTVCAVVLTGVFGALIGHKLLELVKVKNDIAIGLSLGAVSHVIGTASCIETGKEEQVVMGTSALIIVGILSAILFPILIKIF